MTDRIKYLRRSIKESVPNRIELKCTKGKLPQWLNGTYFRNGPGRYEFADNRSYEHMFDGQACIQKFEIHDSRIFYTSKILETKCYTKTVADQRLYPNFGTDEELKGFWNFLPRLIKFARQPETNDNVNVNLASYANEQLYALSETNRFCRIDPHTLEIIETSNIKDYVSSIMTTIAHPHVEKDGSWITCGLNPKGFAYEFLKFDVGPDGHGHNVSCKNAKVIASLSTNHWFGLSYFHSFGVTENYIVFLEQSLVLSYWHLILSILSNAPISSCFKPNKTFPTHIHLINKHTGQVVEQKFVTIPQFAFHYLNCFEVLDNSGSLKEICIDVCSYNIDTFDINNFTYENLYSGKVNESCILNSNAKRITVPFIQKSESSREDEIYCEIKVINSIPFELPVINYRRNNGKPYKFVYGVSYYAVPFAVVKFNVHEEDGKVLKIVYDGESDDLLMPSEPVFVERCPDNDKVDEDDGVLLVMVLSKKNKDFLSVVDAKNLVEICRFEIEDAKFAFTFHGFFADRNIFPRLNEES